MDYLFFIFVVCVIIGLTLDVIYFIKCMIISIVDYIRKQKRKKR